MRISLLIKLVKERRPIWDRKHVSYHDRMVTTCLWGEVAKILRTNVNTARIKWKGLRDTFRAELKKLGTTLPDGSTIKATKWEYFDDMLFIKDQIYINKKELTDMIDRSSINMNNECDEWEPIIKVEPLQSEEEVEDEIVIPPKLGRLEGPTNTSPPSRSVECKSPSSTTDERIVPQMQWNLSLQRQPQMDDDYNFLMSILPQLRTLPTTRNLLVRLKIQELLYNEIVKIQG